MGKRVVFEGSDDQIILKDIFKDWIGWAECMTNGKVVTGWYDG